MTAPPPSSSSPHVARHPHQLGAHAAALVALSAAALAAGAKVGEDVFAHETAPFDAPVRAWVLAHQSPLARALFLGITRVGSPTVVIPFTAVAAAWLWHRRGRRIAGTVVLAPGVATACFLLLKHLYGRARPAGGMHLLTSSFPSGHATAAAAIFPTLAYVLWREELLDGPLAAAAGATAALAIGASRVYLDVHWATDVLGGWSLGTMLAALGAVAYERVRRRTREHGAAVQDVGSRAM